MSDAEFSLSLSVSYSAYIYQAILCHIACKLQRRLRKLCYVRVLKLSLGYEAEAAHNRR